jgi:hypothetical protein
MCTQLFQFLPTGQIASQHYGAVLELEIATPAKVEEAELMHSGKSIYRFEVI